MLARLLYLALNVYGLGLIVYGVCSWVQHPSTRELRNWLSKWYEPLLAPIRRRVKPVRMGAAMLDMAPLLLFVAIVVVQRLILALLYPPGR